MNPEFHTCVHCTPFCYFLSWFSLVHRDGLYTAEHAYFSVRQSQLFSYFASFLAPCLQNTA